MKIGILTTHPIQYHAPLFRDLASREGISLTVYFAHQPTPQEQGVGFGVAFEWDIDLTAGYRHVFLENVSTRPAHGIRGYDTPEIIEIVRKEHFDLFIVHGWNYKSSWQAFRACWETGTKLAIRSDSQLPQEAKCSLRQKLKGLVKKLVYPHFISRFDVCLPYGQRSAEYFRYFGGKKIIVSPHFIDNNWFAQSAGKFRKERDVLRQEWQIPEGAVCFLFCGKFQTKKRPMDVLKAIERGCTRNEEPGAKERPLHLLMVGDGEMRHACEKYARERGLPVTFAGFLNQGKISKAYVAADCLVLPSDSGETWGLVVNEAMACGLPTIVSDACGCVPDLILEGENGYTYPCGDVEALYEKMTIFLDDNCDYMRIQKAALDRVNHSSVKQAADRLLEAAS
jgi:glycosyltransferase involved in cell wall biosynthesis